MTWVRTETESAGSAIYLHTLIQKVPTVSVLHKSQIKISLNKLSSVISILLGALL